MPGSDISRYEFVTEWRLARQIAQADRQVDDAILPSVLQRRGRGRVSSIDLSCRRTK
jgi:hypothetical protein